MGRGQSGALWGVSNSFLSKSLVFSRLYLLGGRGASSLIFWVNNWANLYAGAPRQLTAGQIGCSGLCNLISPLMDGAVGFRFMYFHFDSEGISVLLLFITFLTWDWNDFVGLFFEVWKSFVCKNFSILDSYCVVGRITKEFPLSAFAIIAPFSVSFVFMFLMALGSNCKFRVCDGVLFFCSVLMRSAVSFLHISHSGGRRREMAVSASRARF